MTWLMTERLDTSRSDQGIANPSWVRLTLLKVQWQTLKMAGVLMPKITLNPWVLWLGAKLSCGLNVRAGR